MRLIGPRLISLISLDVAVLLAQRNGMARHRAIPVLITNDNNRSVLTRIRLGNGLHDENWLQTLIHDHPAILPVSDIEPGFGDLIAAARDGPRGPGNIVNRCMLPSGATVQVETHTRRTPQMRSWVGGSGVD